MYFWDPSFSVEQTICQTAFSVISSNYQKPEFSSSGAINR